MADPGSAPAARHLVLVGLPGSGKTTTGAVLARRLGRGFLDFDAELVRREGMSVAAIFERHGEAHFRALERALTEELRLREGMVLSPGGGWITQPDVVALLRPPARLVYLRTTPATALKRMGRGVGSRPLLAQLDPLAELERLLAARARLYERADLEIDVERLGAKQVAVRLAELVERLDAAPPADGARPG